MKAILVDDEEMSRNVLRELLETYCPGVQIAGEAASAEDAFELILKISPELVFLDIEMPHGSGFDLLNRFQKVDFEVIFVTAFDKYALKAIKFCALDYLLKPVSIEELKTAVQKMKEKQAGKSRSRQFEILLSNLQDNKGTNNQIALPTLEGLEFVKVKNIIRCEADGRYTNIYMAKESPLLVTRNLKEFENLLDEHSFLRVHHAHLINLDYIKKYYKGDGGYVQMEDGSNVEVSRRKKDTFLQIFSNR